MSRIIQILNLFVLFLWWSPGSGIGQTLKRYGGHYSEERIANLRSNCQKYDWAKKQKASVISRAASWLAKSDQELWEMVPGQDLPRTIDVGYDRFNKGPKFVGCIVCGDKIFQYGNYPYDPDFVNKPWKLTCPSCGSVFPTNDFEKYYQSAIDEHGLFNPAKGDTSLLYNTDHPDPNDPLHKYGVDDGFGFVYQGRAYKYIGYYVWKYWMHIINGLNALADGYLYTGNQQYAHKAAILLDRIADVYPSMDWKPYADRGWYHSDGNSGRGKIEGCIWETGVVQSLADAYDKILSGTVNDTSLYEFLNVQSRKYKLPASKGSRKLFISNVDEGILKTAFDAVLALRIRGNQGMHQLTVATCALAMNTNPKTREWLDWLFAPAGGAIPGLMVETFDRDGTSDEGAPAYSLLWGKQVFKLATILHDYSGYDDHDIFRDFPQFKKVFTVAYRMAALGKAIPNIGDYGSTGLVDMQLSDPPFMAMGYHYTKDSAIALAAYRANDYSSKGLGLDIFSKDPELSNREIQQIGERAGPRPVGGYLMSGFGLALLEAGNETSQFALANNYGRTKMHGHLDLLNFDLFAYGNWLTPDLGYPEFATNIPSTTDWVKSTISHNTVYVNNRPQERVWGGKTRIFNQLKNFGVCEIDGEMAYPGIEQYSRTMLIIGNENQDGKDQNAYVVDIFRVKGGDDHLYSFHGPPGEVQYTGLRPDLQPTGTYAGENIVKGTKSDDFPIGFSFLYNVRKDKHPAPAFMLDWKVEHGYRNIVDKDSIHLRMHALTKVSDVALANGDPPNNKPGNPKTLTYVLLHNTGSSLRSTFVSVFEPYRGKPFIKSVQRLDNENGDEIIISVDKMNGETDYILYNNKEDKFIKLTNGIKMEGKIGLVRLKGKNPIEGILINGSSLRYKQMNLKSSGMIQGKVITMTKDLKGDGSILLDAGFAIDRNVIGEQIMIETSGERDATYTIHDVQKEGEYTRIFCGPVSFVKAFKGGKIDVRGVRLPGSYNEGYEYDFEEGAAFRIGSVVSWMKK